jgi:hypothetical protein
MSGGGYISAQRWDRAMRLLAALRAWSSWDSPDHRAAVSAARAGLTPALWRSVEARRKRPRAFAEAVWLLATAADDDSMTVRSRARAAIRALLFERFGPARDGRALAAGDAPHPDPDDPDPVEAWEAD